MKLSRIVLSIALLSSLSLQAGVVNVGSGSYTTDHPGYDQAGRNKVPAGTPQLSGDAVGHPVPTNDWWSNVLYKDQSENIFAYPMGMRTRADGLTLAYIPKGAMVDFSPVHISVGNITSAKTTVSDYSDWTFTMRWGSGSEYFDATAGLAMPFVYFTNTAHSRSLSHSAREWALFLSMALRLCCRKASTERRLPSMPLRAARGQAAATATRRHLEARTIGRRQYCRCRQPMPLPQHAACGNMRLSFLPTHEWITATTRLPHRCALTMW
ncbi:MAG: hypothetical protein L6U61_00350 [Bacteroidales bacterium]|nr:MAG: hypothetical protein L6U61_00350 [Bacteroidales bacterium]